MFCIDLTRFHFADVGVVNNFNRAIAFHSIGTSNLKTVTSTNRSLRPVFQYLNFFQILSLPSFSDWNS